MTEKRMQIFELIDSERQYQNEKWGGHDHDVELSVGDWLVFLDTYLDKAKKKYTSEDAGKTINYITKIAALAIAALEYNTGEATRE